MVLLSNGYGSLLIAIFCSIALAATMLIVAWVVNPKAPNALKNTPYESGMPVIGTGRIQFDVKFYLFTLLFILFDIEAIFLFPWAVSFERLGFLGIAEVLIFLVILFVGLIYAWRRKALEWQ